MDDMPSDVGVLQGRLRKAREEFSRMAKLLATADMRAIKAEHLLCRIQAIVNGEGGPGPMMGLTDDECSAHGHLISQVETMASDQTEWVSHLMRTGQMG